MDLKWQDAEDIAIRLVEEHPDADLLTIRFTDMHAWIVALPDFKDDPKNQTRKSSKRSRWPGTRNIRIHNPDPPCPVSVSLNTVTTAHSRVDIPHGHAHVQRNTRVCGKRYGSTVGGGDTVLELIQFVKSRWDRFSSPRSSSARCLW